KATKAGIKPILGCEAYVVTKGTRFDRPPSAERESKRRGGEIYHHLLLLVKNETGYRNLIKLCTLAHTEGFYYKPRIDLELLSRYHEGLVCTSACPIGIIGSYLVNDDYEQARTVAGTYKEIFGDDFYVEIQNHGMDIEQKILLHAPKIAQELGLKVVATNDCHYIKPEHAIPHNIMLCIPDASSAYTPDYRALRYGSTQLYFKSAREMSELFKDFPAAIETTAEIGEKCALVLDLKKNYMPDFPIPKESGARNLEEYLEKLATEGIRRRYNGASATVEQRLRHELDVINRMGYAGYFLIVQDFISKAREMGVRVGPGRGSAAGSIVSYALGITDIDPLKFDLLFERFLNPDRVSMPDIDIDFSDSKREKVIDYVRQKYGESSVAQIITFGSLSARAVLKDVGRVLGIQLGTIDSITKQIPVVQGKVTKIAEALETIPDLKWVKESNDEKIQLLVDTAQVLEGMHRNVSTHAAGVVIAPGDISVYVPMYKTPQTDLMTQYNMKDLEEAGLLKMDFLGLRTLTVIENALELIRKDHGIEIDLDTIPESDEKTLELFSKGQTVAVFQFESSGMQDYLRKLKPTSIGDLVAMNALYRPGPMEMIPDFIQRKHGKQKITYLHPSMEPILRDTYGVIVYQEQVMQIASAVAGFTLAQADLMRRAMGKKDKELMAKQKKEFADGANKKGIDKKTAGEIFDLIEKFASYGFNKSHAAAYSVLAYQTAYLKAHYPAEYMAATLSSEMDNTDKIVLFIDDCHKMGIPVLPPDVNESGVQFGVSGNAIRFGLSAIKNVGVSAVEQIVITRNEKGKFTDIFDFCSRVDLRLTNKRTIESLIQAGAFDSLHDNRAQLYGSVDRTITFGQAAQESSGRGQSMLFDGPTAKILARPALPATPEWSEMEKLSREKSLLGFYVSGHPLMKFRDEIEAFASAKLGDPQSVRPNSTVRVCGIITSIKKLVDKRGNLMAFATIEDFTGKAECIIFSDPYKKHGEVLVVSSIIMVIGRNDGNEEAIKVIVNDVIPIDKVRERFTKSILLNVNLDALDEGTIFELGKLLEKHRGNCACYFNVNGGGLGRNSVYFTRKFVIDPSNQFISAVKSLLGEGSVRLQG
ncbi:MAG TPA: DNA polymerase III subunit alpha, partial [Bacteroidota bacterium]|nr:DNA polymerase III subunit alpha [Bacteroidota bacterium]